MDLKSEIKKLLESDLSDEMLVAALRALTVKYERVLLKKAKELVGVEVITTASF